jgi:hypothetical protein
VSVEAVARCALRLGEVAEDVRTAAARAAVAVPRDWLGTAGAAYADALEEAGVDVRRVASAYGAAADALLPYARGRAEAELVAEQARRLRDRASGATAVAALTGTADAGAELRAAADRLDAEAAELERRAAAECAATLRELALRAPRARRSASAWRFASDAVGVVGGTVRGIASIASSAAHALPFLNGGGAQRVARHELAEQAVAMMRVWETPVQMWHDLLDGRPGLALGAAAMFGRTPKGLIRDPHLAHREALREAGWRSLMQGREPRPVSAGEMGKVGADLVNEELRGGHTLHRHVAATRGYLMMRTRGGVPVAGTFRDLPTAQQLVDAVLLEHADRLREAYGLTGRQTLVLRSEFPFVTGRVNVEGSPRTVPCRAVTVVLKLEGGQPHVRTAYPDV